MNILPFMVRESRRSRSPVRWAGLFLFALMCVQHGTGRTFAIESEQQTIQAPQAFILNAFGEAGSKPRVLWLNKELQGGIEKILGHRLAALRLRYWHVGTKTGWILNEIGKEQPITAGFVVEGGKLTEANVLVYRESRGWEVKYPAFRNQFIGAAIDENFRIDKNIDGISGATLSVNAMVRMARLSLFFHNHVTSKGNG